MRKLWVLVVLMAAVGLVAGCQKKDQGQAQKPPDQKQPEESAKAPPESMKPDEREQPAPSKPDVEEGEQRAEKKGEEMKPQEEAKKPSDTEPVEPQEGEAATPAPPERTVEQGRPKEEAGPESVRRMDNQLEREFKRKMRADSRLSEYEVKASVRNCELTITGSVPNEELKMKADALAKTVAGLKAVKNELATNAKMAEISKMTDDDFKGELKDKIEADGQLRDHKLDVVVLEGKATITGTVPSEELKKKVTMLAETVQGLGEVKNDVRVQEAAQGAAAPGEAKPKTAAENAPAPEGKGAQPQPSERREGAPEESRSDWAMAMELRTKLLSDSQLNGYDIEADVSRGIISITGAVPNEEMKRKAERLAKSVADAREIRNNINIVEGPVPPPEARSDTAIKAELKAKLLSDSELSGWKTKLDVNNGIVTMSGTVATEDAKKKAGMLAETVAGVKEIRNDIRVEAARERTAMGDNMEDMGRDADQKKPGTEQDTKEKGAEMSDDALAKKIEAKYMTEAQLKGSDIQAQVKKGTATLTGTVRSEEQRQMAERIARQTEGVKEVKNKLEVKPAEMQ